jgi:uncharacterized protein YlxW (UPF0749 family)
MAGRLAQISLGAVAVVIGLLLVGQLRSQARPIELSTLSAQDLSTLVEALSAQNVELSDNLADLREQIRDYERAEVQGESDLTISQEDLRRIAAFGGLAGVEGQGIEVEVAGALDPTALNDLIQELRNAGAEAIAVDDVRITARSVAVLGTRAIEIDGVEIGSGFEIRAIGSPEGLKAAIDRPGGIMALLEQVSQVRVVVTPTHELSVPATRLELTPEAGRIGE